MGYLVAIALVGVFLLGVVVVQSIWRIDALEDRLTEVENRPSKWSPG